MKQSLFLYLCCRPVTEHLTSTCTDVGSAPGTDSQKQNNSPPRPQPKPFFHINPRSLAHFKATSDLFNSLAGCVLLTFYNLDLSLCPWLSSRSLQGSICCPCASLGQWKTKQCTWRIYSQFFVYSFNMVTGSWMCFFVVLVFWIFLFYLFFKGKKRNLSSSKRKKSDHVGKLEEYLLSSWELFARRYLGLENQSF